MKFLDFEKWKVIRKDAGQSVDEASYKDSEWFFNTYFEDVREDQEWRGYYWICDFEERKSFYNLILRDETGFIPARIYKNLLTKEHADQFLRSYEWRHFRGVLSQYRKSKGYFLIKAISEKGVMGE